MVVGSMKKKWVQECSCITSSGCCFLKRKGKGRVRSTGPNWFAFAWPWANQLIDEKIDECICCMCVCLKSYESMMLEQIVLARTSYNLERCKLLSTFCFKLLPMSLRKMKSRGVPRVFCGWWVQQMAGPTNVFQVFESSWTVSICSMFFTFCEP